MIRRSTILATLLAAVAAQAAEPAVALHLGIKAGGNYAIQWGPDAIKDAGFFPGIVGGLQVPVWLAERIAVTPEITYSGKFISWDAVDSASGDSTLYPVRRYLSYMEVPLAIQYLIPKKGPFVPYIGLAPVVSTLVSAKQVAYKGSVTKTRDLAEGMKTVDFAVALCGGAHLPVAKGGIVSLDVRYALGLLNVAKSGTLRNSCIGLSLGYAFRMEKQKEEW